VTTSRTGAIARFSPMMDEVRKFAQRGGHVIRDLQRFQILLEAGMLPARCGATTAQVRLPRRPPSSGERDDALDAQVRAGRSGSGAIGHGDGNYYIDPKG